MLKREPGHEYVGYVENRDADHAFFVARTELLRKFDEIWHVATHCDA